MEYYKPIMFSTTAVNHAFPFTGYNWFFFRESPFRESDLSSVFLAYWVIIRIEIRYEKRCVIV